jgi:trehalose 6-phosphate phosphatase
MSVPKRRNQLRVVTESVNSRSPGRLPSALDCLDAIFPGEEREPALFLDYDGTLTPIVSSPDAAVLSDAMRLTLCRLGARCEVAIVSGRDLPDVRERVGIPGLWYAGSHGFDIDGPDDKHRAFQMGGELLPTLDAAGQTLRDRLAGVPGCLVERKRFSIAIHYRQVDDDQAGSVARIIADTCRACPGLRLATGRKILELQPAIDWDKGKALRWLMQTLDMDPGRFIAIYIGDDVTDEDAFRELEAEGVGILVSQQRQSTRARYRLDDTAAVQVFLNRLADGLERLRS